MTLVPAPGVERIVSFPPAAPPVLASPSQLALICQIVQQLAKRGLAFLAIAASWTIMIVGIVQNALAGAG